MNTHAPSLRTLALLIAFLGSCVGLTVYLWLAFGGPVPLKPESYRMKVPFEDATGLVAGADVRIAGVDIGKVVATELDSETTRTVAEIDVSEEFAPRPADTRAMLRGKSLLGEVYVELTPGSPDERALPDGGRLSAGRVQQRVQLADVLNTFDTPTRTALSTWLAGGGRALEGRGPSLNRLLAELEPFETSTGAVVEILRQEDRAMSGLIRDSGAMFSAFAERPGQLGALVRNSARAFRAIAARDAGLADTFRILPTFLTETRVTSARLGRFAEETTPLVDQLIPAARELAPVMADVEVVAPSLRRLMAGIGPLSAAARQGIPALERLLDETAPALERGTPYLGELIPAVEYLDVYRREIAGLLGNVSAATQATLPATGGGESLHYLRSSVPISLESLAPLPFRFGSSRTNPYPKPGTATDLADVYAQFGSYLCVNRPLPAVGSDIPADLQEAIADSYFTDVPGNDTGQPLSPPCRDSGPLGPAVGGGNGYFPRLEPLP